MLKELTMPLIRPRWAAEAAMPDGVVDRSGRLLTTTYLAPLPMIWLRIRSASSLPATPIAGTSAGPLSVPYLAPAAAPAVAPAAAASACALATIGPYTAGDAVAELPGWVADAWTAAPTMVALELPTRADSAAIAAPMAAVAVAGLVAVAPRPVARTVAKVCAPTRAPSALPAAVAAAVRPPSRDRASLPPAITNTTSVGLKAPPLRLR